MSELPCACLSQIQQLFEDADDAGMLLFSKEPNTVGCNGYVCGEWSWVSRETALEEFVYSHCPSELPRLSEFDEIPLPQ